MLKDSHIKIVKRKPLKADFHLHSAEDPLDRIRYNAKELILKAADKGFNVISITNHNQVTFNQDLFDFARERGILLIPGIEMTIQHRHVLVLNPPAYRMCSDFPALSKLRRPETLIIAPHPFFPGTYSLNGRFLKHLDLFDALEYSHYYSQAINFNQKAVEIAQSFGFPMVGNSDAHFLSQMGTTYSLIEAEKNIESVFSAIRQNRIHVVSRPLKHSEMGGIANRFLRMKMLVRKGTRRKPARYSPSQDLARKVMSACG